MTALKSLGKVVSSGLGAFGKAPGIDAPQFQGIRTPSLNLSPTGTLTRRSGAGQLAPRTEAGLLSELSAGRTGLAGLRGEISGLRAGLQPIKARTEGLFGQTAALKSNLTGQLEELRPGFGRLTESRVTAVKSAASKASGNLRTNLAKRDIGGSSFANQQIASVEQDFANEEDRVRAESFIQEQQAQQQIISQIGNLLQLDQATLNQQASQIGLELGLTAADAQLFAQNMQSIQVSNAVLQTRINREMRELGISGDIITRVQSIASNVAVAQAKLDAENAIGAGKGIGSAITGLGDFIPQASDLISSFGGGQDNSGGPLQGFDF